VKPDTQRYSEFSGNHPPLRETALLPLDYSVE
jgi:hypothetical protein